MEEVTAESSTENVMQHDDDSSGDEEEMQPDHSMGDYYCKLCDSHMVSDEMWKSHVTGKRHMKNLKKGAHDEPIQFKRKQIDTKPLIQDELDAEEQPIIGLQYMCEVQPANQKSLPTYTCYLCHASMKKAEFITHVISMKHRLLYLKKVDPDGHELIANMEVKKDVMEALVVDKAHEIEGKEGRGQMTVKLEKLKFDLLTKLSKRPMDGDSHFGALNKKRYLDNESCTRGFPNPGFTPGEIRFFDIDTKLRMLEELSQCEIHNDAEARVVENAFDLLSECLMQFKIRCMPPHERMKWTRGLLPGAGGLDKQPHFGGYPHESRPFPGMSNSRQRPQPNFRFRENVEQVWSGY